jgi:hypothetical protein
MIETDKVDLGQGFAIEFVEPDGPVDFAGDSVQTRQGGHGDGHCTFL